MAVAWHQIGMVHQEAGQLDAAEHAYQQSLVLNVQHGNRPWKAFAILHALEHALGHADAASQARQQALDAFLAYRLAGGENHSPAGRLVAVVGQAIAAGEAAAMAARLEQIAGQVATEIDRRLMAALLQILAGSRDLALAADPELTYESAVELRLLLSALGPTTPE